MIDDPLDKALLGDFGVKLLPDSLREAAIHDAHFLIEFGLYGDTTVSFESSGIEFSADKLFETIRASETSDGDVQLDDRSGKRWSVSLKADGDAETRAVLTEGDRRCVVVLAALILGDAQKRCEDFKRQARQAG